MPFYSRKGVQGLGQIFLPIPPIFNLQKPTICQIDGNFMRIPASETDRFALAAALEH